MVGLWTTGRLDSKFLHCNIKSSKCFIFIQKTPASCLESNKTRTGLKSVRLTSHWEDLTGWRRFCRTLFHIWNPNDSFSERPQYPQSFACTDCRAFDGLFCWNAWKEFSCGGRRPSAGAGRVHSGGQSLRFVLKGFRSQTRQSLAG